MSKILAATCVAGVVTAEGVPVPAAVVLSAGVAQSSGILIVDADKAWYIALSSSDLKTTIEKVSQALTQTATGLASAGPTLDSLVPGSGAPVSAAAVQINAIVVELTALKEALK